MYGDIDPPNALLNNVGFHSSRTGFIVADLEVHPTYSDGEVIQRRLANLLTYVFSTFIFIAEATQSSSPALSSISTVAESILPDPRGGVHGSLQRRSIIGASRDNTQVPTTKERR